MHELSIVQSLIGLCEKNAMSNKAKEVMAVHIKIGKLSGVESHYLQSAFDVCKNETICQNATLHIHVQNVIVKCRICHEQSELNNNEFICQKCGSSDLEVIDGEDMMLMRLEMA
jgi:hydrogenase nickel insertion protein hypA